MRVKYLYILLLVVFLALTAFQTFRYKSDTPLKAKTECPYKKQQNQQSGGCPYSNDSNEVTEDDEETVKVLKVNLS